MGSEGRGLRSGNQKHTVGHHHAQLSADRSYPTLNGSAAIEWFAQRLVLPIESDSKDLV